MAKKIVAGNWKMNTLKEDAVSLAKEVVAKATASVPEDVTLVLGTPFVHIAAVKEALAGQSKVFIAAQNCSDKESGAYTGEISAPMLKSYGVDYVILGHSERREYFKESNAELAAKVNIVLANDMKVIFCCGEVLEEREANKQEEVVSTQLAESLYHLTIEQLANVVVAYEPVWAIGTGKTASSEQAQEIHAFIRKELATKFGEAVAAEVTIQYGGSCKPGNAKEIFAGADVDGGLIGGAALKADDFIAIATAY